jgi:hypothetical protein
VVQTAFRSNEFVEKRKQVLNTVYRERLEQRAHNRMEEASLSVGSEACDGGKV